MNTNYRRFVSFTLIWGETSLGMTTRNLYLPKITPFFNFTSFLTEIDLNIIKQNDESENKFPLSFFPYEIV